MTHAGLAEIYRRVAKEARRTYEGRGYIFYDCVCEAAVKAALAAEGGFERFVAMGCAFDRHVLNGPLND